MATAAKPQEKAIDPRRENGSQIPSVVNMLAGINARLQNGSKIPTRRNSAVRWREIAPDAICQSRALRIGELGMKLGMKLGCHPKFIPSGPKLSVNAGRKGRWDLGSVWMA